MSKNSAYIGLNIKKWMYDNEIPVLHRPLFLELAVRMSPLPIAKLDNIVRIAGIEGDVICDALGWSQKSSLMKGLRALCDCGAIRRVSKGVYQVSDKYVRSDVIKDVKNNGTGN